MSLLQYSGPQAFSLDNWGSAPYNRTSFQHVQQLLPTARLRRGSAQTTPLVQAPQSVNALSYRGADGNQRTVQQMLDSTYTDAFVVAKHGIVLAEEYRNGMTPDSHHLLNSVSKSVLGALVGILASEDRIDPSAPLTTYIPEFNDTSFRGTTVQQALDMTAAVKYGEDYTDPHADFWHETAVVGWRPALVHAGLPKTLFDFACSLGEVEQHNGAQFHYRTVLTNVIAMAVARATDQSVAALVEQKLWQPLGCEQDASVVVDRTGFPYFGAGMSACARDLLRFGQMLAQDGTYNGAQIVPADWVKETLAGNETLKALFAAGDYAELFPGGHYRNQIWADAARQLLVCIGIHGQTIYINQSTGVVIVKLSTHPEPADMPLFADTFAAMQALCESL